MVLPIPDTGLPSGWEDMQNGFMLQPLVRFAQEDINQGKVYYRHSGGEVTSDYFMFEVRVICCLLPLEANSGEFAREWPTFGLFFEK